LYLNAVRYYSSVGNVMPHPPACRRYATFFVLVTNLRLAMWCCDDFSTEL